MEYESFTPDDWVFDARFRNWVLNPSEPEDRFWQPYIEAHPAQREAIAQARILILYSQHPPAVPAEQLDRSWQTVRNRLQTPTVRPLLVKRWLAVAASVTVLLLAGAGYWAYQNSPETYETAYGETRKLTLHDGSAVTLNANSRLRLARRWKPGDDREVWLEGEAFFSVTHQQNHQKFIVHARELDVQVLGTAFNVFTRPKAVKVMLESGRVQLSPPARSQQASIVMKPGQLFEVRANGTSSLRSIKPEFYSAWKENRLILNQTTLADLVEILRDNYGLTVDVQPEELLQLRASGSMPLTNADDLLTQIGRLFALEISRSADRIRLTKQ
ncbi:FecR domain-containing protein [Larkinella bovis]|uniref:FecR domain-containing protein n=1 Tax=Larkinella bovis TaxID=683041 RepID=A0ABW0IE27_9BACT